jgi:lipopolysaccharide export system permease protein
MAILWRHLLFSYFKVVCFSTVAFIALLLTLRLEEIAHFATLGSSGIYIFYFILYQIPYILPIALPVSALIAAMILTQRLSANSELTALRAAGFSLPEIFAPLLVGSILLGTANFYIVSELATSSHLATSLIKSELRCINPLLLLSNKHLMKNRGLYFDSLGPSRMGEFATDVVIAMPDKKHHRLNLLLADSLHTSPMHIDCRGMTLISSLNAKEGEEALLIENIAHSNTSIEDFSQLVQKKVWVLNNDHLRLSLLLVRLHEERQQWQDAKDAAAPESELKGLQRSINRIHNELLRRLSVGMSVVSFTMLGACCGIQVGRRHSRRGLILVVSLSALYLAAYFSAKGIEHLQAGPALFYLLPHLLLCGTALWLLRRATRGVE